jgi:hypothetical protein
MCFLLFVNRIYNNLFRHSKSNSKYKNKNIVLYIKSKNAMHRRKKLRIKIFRKRRQRIYTFVKKEYNIQYN